MYNNNNKGNCVCILKKKKTFTITDDASPGLAVKY